MEIYWNKVYGEDELAKIITTTPTLEKVISFDMIERLDNELKSLTDSQRKYGGRVPQLGVSNALKLRYIHTQRK